MMAGLKPIHGLLGKRWCCALLILCLTGCDTGSETTVTTYEPGEELPGGVSTNTLLLGGNAFTMPAANITPEHESMFFSGNAFFNQPWVQAPASTKNRDGLGPLFNARSCAACHFKDGRGRPPASEDESFLGILLRLSVPGENAHGGPLGEPVYGGQLQPFAIPGVPAEGRPSVRYNKIAGQYGDGTAYELMEPVYTISDLGYGPMREDVMVSARVAPAVTGLGLLEAIDISRLQALEDPDDADGDGISGRINWVWDVTTQTMAPGRFGWKADEPTVRQQSAGAFLGDMGITTGLFPNQECTEMQVECREAKDGGNAAGLPEVEDHMMDRVEVYMQLLAVPVRDRFRDEETLRGKRLFGEIGCATCHVASHRTSPTAKFVELQDQQIWPYTDLLLHDMGEGLSDGRPVFGASGSEWRTPPLWGLRFYKVVNGHEQLLHDGRARGVAEAILWHGGEGESAKEKFRLMSVEDREALVRFVESL